MSTALRLFHMPRALACVLSLPLLAGCATGKGNDPPVGTTRTPLLWSSEVELKESEPLAQDDFGSPVAISGDTAIVGADTWKGAGKLYQGAAFVFVRTPMGWTQQAILTAADATFFSSSIAISGDTAVVGAVMGGGTGTAYVFHRSGSEWTLQAAWNGPSGGAEFGYSASISGDTAVVGSPYANKASIYARSAASWHQQAELSAPQPTDVYFGISVSVSGSTCLVGEQDSESGGRVFVYDRTGDNWSQSAILGEPDAGKFDRFGGSISLDSDTVLIRGSHPSAEAGATVPAVYVYVRKGGAWQQEAVLTAPDSGPKTLFGRSVALSGDVAVIAAGDDATQTPPTTNVAYMFRRTSGVWTQEGVVTQSAANGYNIESTSVGVSGNTAVVGVSQARICTPGDDSCMSTLYSKGAFVAAATDGDASVPDAEAADHAIAPESGEPESGGCAEEGCAPDKATAESGGGCEASGRRTRGSPALALALLAMCAGLRRRWRLDALRLEGNKP